MAAPISLPLPPYMTGKQVSAFSIQPASVAATGNLAYATAADLRAMGTFKEMTFRMNFQQANIKPSFYTVANNVDMEMDFEVTLRDLRTDDGYSAVVESAAIGTPYMRILCQNTSFSLGAGFVFCVVGIRRTVGLNQGEGEHNGDITLVGCGIAPYYGLAASNPI